MASSFFTMYALKFNICFVYLGVEHASTRLEVIDSESDGDSNQAW